MSSTSLASLQQSVGKVGRLWFAVDHGGGPHGTRFSEWRSPAINEGRASRPPPPLPQLMPTLSKPALREPLAAGQPRRLPSRQAAEPSSLGRHSSMPRLKLSTSLPAMAQRAGAKFDEQFAARLLETEVRLNQYLAERSGGSASNDAKPKRSISSSSVDPAAGLDPEEAVEVRRMHEDCHETLYEMWESPRRLKPVGKPTTGDGLSVDPLSQRRALDLLRSCSACAELSPDELLAVLHTGTRRLLPR